MEELSARNRLNGEILTSRETVERVGDGEVQFEPSRAVELQGVAAPVELFHAARRT